MNSAVVVALIGAGVALVVGFVSLFAALRSASITARQASRDTVETLTQQGLALDRTLGEQNLRTLNERFATAADRLGSDKPPAVRLAGVYAMAGLADEWEKNRQTCIAVLCGYLRMPPEPDPGLGPETQKQREFRSSREVRWTLMRVITEHLRDPDAGSERKLSGVGKRAAPESWRSDERYFDFSGAVFDGGTFSDAQFCGGKATFSRAKFSCRKDDKVSFRHTKFSDGEVSFHHATFTRGAVDFHAAEFSGRVVSFEDAKFSGGEISFELAKFSGGEISFEDAEFSGGVVSFKGAKFSGAVVSFEGAKFSGAVVSFEGAEFSRGSVDFSKAADWSHPPMFDWEGAPPDWVKLPAAASGESQ